MVKHVKEGGKELDGGIRRSRRLTVVEEKKVEENKKKNREMRREGGRGLLGSRGGRGL